MNIENARTLAATLISSPIKNQNLHIGIMCVVAKESGFEISPEKSYRRTSNERIRKIFRRVRKLEESDLTRLKKNDVAFFNYVYGGRVGNNRSGDGYKYRGRGFNQLTFKGNYERYCPPWCDILECPHLVSILPSVASYILVDFFVYNLDRFESRINARYGEPDSDDAGIKIAANINAGMGNGKNSRVVKYAVINAKKHLDEVRDIYDEIRALEF